MLIFNLGNFPLENGTVDHSSMSWTVCRTDERKYLMIQQQQNPNYIIGRLITVPERNNITQVPTFGESWLVMTYLTPRSMHLIPLSSYLALLILFTQGSIQIDAVPIMIDESNLYEPITMNRLLNNFFQNPAWIDSAQPVFYNNDLQFVSFPIHGKTFILLNTYDATTRYLYLFELDYNSVDPHEPLFMKTWTLIKSYNINDNYTTQIRIIPNCDITDDNYSQFAVFCLNNSSITASDIFIYNVSGTLNNSIDCSGIPTFSGVTWSYPSIDVSVIRLHDDKGHCYIEHEGSAWSNTPIIYSNIDKSPFYRENLDSFHFMEFSNTVSVPGQAGDLSLRVIRRINETLGILSQASMIDPTRNIVVQTGVIIEDRPWQHFYFKYAFDLYALFFRKYQDGGSTSTDWTNPRDYYIIFLDAQNS